MKRDHAEVVSQFLLENRRMERELRTDDLTGLGNHRALKESLQQRERRSFGLLFIDIDFFKLVNEEHGHLSASGVLRDFGVMLGTLAQARGYAAFRYAGDEFVVIDDRLSADITTAAEELRRLVEQRVFAVNGHRGKAVIRLTVSIGCRVRSPDESVEQILADADKALFEAKRKSRNTAVAYNA